MKSLMIATVAGATLVGCADQAGAPAINILEPHEWLRGTSNNVGNVQFEIRTADARTVQYVGGDINSIKVTLMDADNGNAVLGTTSYSGASLAGHLVAGRFSFEVDNLKVNDGTHPTYHYLARVDAYLDIAQSANIGSSTTSSTFTVTAGQTTSVTSFPALALFATPVGNATATASNAVTIVDNQAPSIVFK